MRSALSIAWKDLRLRLRDRSFFFMGILVPFGLALIFNMVFGGALGEDFRPSYAVVDEDGGSIAQQFVASLEEIATQFPMDLELDIDRDEAMRTLDDNTFDSVFLLPDGLSAAAEAGEPAAIEVIGNVDSPTSSQIARSIAAGFASGVEAIQVSVGTVLTVMRPPPEDLPGIVESAVQVRTPVTIGAIEAASRQLDGTTYLMAGMAVFFLFFTVQFGVTSLLEERQEGTLARLMAAPISRGAVLLGKAITSFVLGMLSMTVLLVAANVLLGAEWGDPAAVGLLVVAGVLSAIGIMGVVAAIAKSAEGAGSVQAIIAVTLGMLGGTFFPVGQGGGLLARLSFVTPHRWFMRGLSDLAGGGGVEVVVPSLLAMLTFAVVTGGVAAVILQRRSLA
jgi:ABC-2 type transport system permease protein